MGISWKMHNKSYYPIGGQVAETFILFQMDTNMKGLVSLDHFKFVSSRTI